MSLVQSSPWEIRLLMWAQEAFESQIVSREVPIDGDVLEAAYRYCADVTRTYSKTFYMASGLLPMEKRRAARALYAFCRVTDNIVDEPQYQTYRRQMLRDWHDKVMSEYPPADSPICIAWADTQMKCNIPRGYAEQLISGVARDIDHVRYETFSDLADYAYGVASTVGLMAMHIIGFQGQEALPYAIKLGVALQLTNILRDVASDWEDGRVYLPQDELRAFNLSDDDIQAGEVTEQWRQFMAFQIDRTRKLYIDARPGIAMLDADGRFAIGAAADLYEAILKDIEANDYDVFSRRAHIGKVGKLTRLPGIWWRSRNSQAFVETT